MPNSFRLKQFSGSFTLAYSSLTSISRAGRVTITPFKKRAQVERGPQA